MISTLVRMEPSSSLRDWITSKGPKRLLIDMIKRLGKTAGIFNQVTKVSLEQNETVLRNISDRTAYLETEFEKLRDHTYVEHPRQSNRIAAISCDLEKWVLQ